MSRSLTTFIQILAGNIVLRLSLAKTRGRVLELRPFNNVTDLLRKLLISKSVVVLARDRTALQPRGKSDWHKFCRTQRFWRLEPCCSRQIREGPPEVEAPRPRWKRRADCLWSDRGVQDARHVNVPHFLRFCLRC